MLTKISQIGSSVGIIIPKYIVSECQLSKGSSINIEYKDNKLIISKVESKRAGWAEKFKKYTAECEDEMLMPDYIDSEAINLI